MDELLTVDEVADYLRVSRSTVWRWCQARKIPAFKIGREWRISAPVLAELMLAQQQGLLPTDSDAGAEEPNLA
jgi:excisionase family DNA binding protein